MIDTGKPVTFERFGSIVGISRQASGSLVARGILAEGAPLGEWLMDYCRHLREQAASRATAGDLDLAGERAALAKAQRERIEMQNAETRAELAPAAQIEAVLAETATRVNAILATIPARVRRRYLPETETGDQVAQVIAEMLGPVHDVIDAMRLDDGGTDHDAESGSDRSTAADDDIGRAECR